MAVFNEFQKVVVGIFDVNGDKHVEFYELYPIFLLMAMILLFYILVTNLNVLIIFKESKMFIAFFALLILYSSMYMINFNSDFSKNKLPTIEDNFYYIINIMNLLVSTLCFIYLSSLLYMK
jgi:hypothetical protein